MFVESLEVRTAQLCAESRSWLAPENDKWNIDIGAHTKNPSVSRSCYFHALLF
jgi:hypothetical protein